MALRANEEWREIERKRTTEGEESQDHKVLTFLEELRTKKRRTGSDDGAKSRGKSKCSTITVMDVCLNYSFRDMRYKLIKSTRDHHLGPRTLKWSTATTIDQMQDTLKEIFFPNQKSLIARSKTFLFAVGTYSGEVIDSSLTLGDYIAGNSKPRLYLLTKQSTFSDIRTEDEQFQNPGPSISNSSPLNTQPLSQMDAVTHWDAGTPTVSFRLPDDSTVRPICYDRHKDTVIIPCGHPLCHPCAVHVSENDRRCPICRQPCMKISCVNA